MKEFNNPLEWQRDSHVFSKYQNKILTYIYCMFNVSHRLEIKAGRNFSIFEEDYKLIKDLGFAEPIFYEAYRLTEKGAKFFNDRKKERILTLDEEKELRKKEIDFNTFPKTTE